MKSIDDFVLKWNRRHSDLSFAIVRSCEDEKPICAEIRYSASMFTKLQSYEEWSKLIQLIEAKSRETMHVVTGRYLFEMGIIDVAIDSSGQNYRDRNVVRVLKTVGKKFYRKKNN